MLAFWIAAAGLSAVVSALVLRGAARASLAVGAGGGDDASLAVHRRQMSEIDDLAERGLLADGELKAARAEVGRRLIAAADRQQAWPAADPKMRPLVLVFAALTPLIALGVYMAVAAPGLVDQPYLQRVAQWRNAELSQLSPEQVAAVLQETAKAKPNDPELFRLLALTRLRAGDPTGAAQALRRAVSLAPDRVDLWVGLGEMFIAEAKGEIGTDAKRAFAEALKRDPANVIARYNLAKARIAEGDLAGGLADWRTVLAAMPADDPRRAGFAEEIARTQAAGGLVSEAPVEQAAAAAGDASGVDGFIQGMVASLAAKLAANPDDADGWVRLVRAYAVLGDTAKRDAALAQAQARFAGQPKVMAALRQAAQTPKADTTP
ncbi:c-type cytochrome biogenesis protein CcmI [soil metagenome]